MPYYLTGFFLCATAPKQDFSNLNPQMSAQSTHPPTFAAWYNSQGMGKASFQ